MSLAGGSLVPCPKGGGFLASMSGEGAIPNGHMRPPVNRQIDTSKNIIFLQSSLSGGNKMCNANMSGPRWAQLSHHFSNSRIEMEVFISDKILQFGFSSF